LLERLRYRRQVPRSGCGLHLETEIELHQHFLEVFVDLTIALEYRLVLLVEAGRAIIVITRSSLG